MDSDSEDLSPVEKLKKQHKKDKKDLQAKIQSLKKTAIKGDKKKKKEVQDEINKLETEMQLKHESELTSVESLEVTNVDAVADNLAETTLDNGPKQTKAQKRRNKKDLSNKEREQRIAEQEIENLTGLRHIETEKIKEKLEDKGLMLFEIPSDGDCLYAAVDHGNVRAGGQPIGVPALRRATANLLQRKKDEYLPFMVDPTSGGPLSDTQFEDYINNLLTTRQWGGQVELGILSHIVEKVIIVVQAEGSHIIMGEEYSDNGTIILTYHRHMYKLGEHYNSVQPYVETPDI